MSKNRNTNNSNNEVKSTDEVRGNKNGSSRTHNNKPNRRGRRGSNNSNSTQGYTASDVHISKPNDISWYTRFPQFAKDAGTLPFSQPLGAPLYLRGQENAPFYVPGIMRIGFYPTVGLSQDNTSPINRASIRFYTWLRAVQKASAKYDHQDATIMMLAMDSCYMFHSLMRRAYGIANLFSPVNKYYPMALLEAMGFDKSIVNNLAEFRQYINRFAISLGQYSIPNSLDLFNRHKWMCEGIYLDSDASPRAQAYMFCPEGFWQYDNLAEVGSNLKWLAWNDQSTNNVTQHTLADVIAFGDSLLNAIAGDEDFALISGDIYALYGDSRVVKLEETPEIFTVLPVYNEVVLSQIENLTIVGKWADTYTPAITQNPSVNAGAIIFDPKFRNQLNAPALREMMLLRPNLNMHVASPGPELVLEASRLAAVPLSWKQDTLEMTFQSFGTEVVSSVMIYTIKPSTGKLHALWTNANILTFDSTANVGNVERAELLAMLTAFDWAPKFFVRDADDKEGYALIGSNCDFDNFTMIESNQMNILHEACLLSEFDVPQMG